MYLEDNKKKEKNAYTFLYALLNKHNKLPAISKIGQFVKYLGAS